MFSLVASGTGRQEPRSWHLWLVNSCAQGNPTERLCGFSLAGHNCSVSSSAALSLLDVAFAEGPRGGSNSTAHGELCPTIPESFGPREQNCSDTHYPTLRSALLRRLNTGGRDKQLLVLGPGKGFVHGAVCTGLILI